MIRQGLKHGVFLAATGANPHLSLGIKAASVMRKGLKHN